MLLFVKVSSYYYSCNFILNLVSDDGQYEIILGKQDSAQWDVGTGASNPLLKYSYNDPTSGQRNVEIELICNDDPQGDLVVVGEPSIGLYKFQLSSKCSCWNGCKGEQFRTEKRCCCSFRCFTSIFTR